MSKKNVFFVLAIFMIGFGGVVGVIFPFFVMLVTKVSANIVITPLFFTLCIAAGLLVGLFNIFLARRIVGKKISQLSQHMGYVEKKLVVKANSAVDDCFEDEKCFTDIDSDDVIGESARAFNALVKALANAFRANAAVRNFSDMLSSRLDLNVLGEEALSKLIENFKSAGGAIVIEKDGALCVLSSFGINNPDEVLNNEIVWSVIKTRKRHLIDFPEDIELNGMLTSFRPKAVLVEPILYKDVVLGVVLLATVSQFSSEMQNNIQLFGQGLALAFKNAITHDQLQRLAANDPLTGIYNRRFGLARLKEEFARGVKANTPLGVLMFDIDHFKRVNDTYGHIVGDKVLIEIVKSAKTTLREGDVFLRYGGEEFLIVMPGASISDVKQIGERLRRTIEDTEIQNYQQTIKVTISLGGASYPEHNADDYLDLINRSDKNLFIAKDLGRNKLIGE